MENRVEELRKGLGMNQEDFAKAIKVSRQTVSSIETGKYNPSLELAFVISNFFNKSIEEIFIYERSKNDEKKWFDNWCYFFNGWYCIFCGLAGAGIMPGIMMLLKYAYWSNPDRKTKYAEKPEEEKIEMHDKSIWESMPSSTGKQINSRLPAWQGAEEIIKKHKNNRPRPQSWAVIFTLILWG